MCSVAASACTKTPTVKEEAVEVCEWTETRTDTLIYDPSNTAPSGAQGAQGAPAQPSQAQPREATVSSCCCCAYLESFSDRDLVRSANEETKLVGQILKNALTKNWKYSVSDTSLEDRVVEVGMGHGANCPHLKQSGVVQLLAIEPSDDRPAPRTDSPRTVTWSGMMECLPLKNESVSVLLATRVLCCVGDLSRSVNEAYRVLVPGGLYIFIEHEGAPACTCRRFGQEVFKKFGEGCDMTRDPLSAIMKTFGKDLVEFKRWRRTFEDPADIGLSSLKVGGYAQKRTTVSLQTPSRSLFMNCRNTVQRAMQGALQRVMPTSQMNDQFFGDFLAGSIFSSTGKRVVGVGLGANVKYLGQAGVQQVLDIDSHENCEAAREAARESGVELVIWKDTVNALPLDNATVDILLATDVLCSAPDIKVAVNEVHRVLHDLGGCYLFMEKDSIGRIVIEEIWRQFGRKHVFWKRVGDFVYGRALRSAAINL